MLVLDDAAQAFGATYRGRKLGALATATATSFFPAKPLGCYGDGGAVFTDDDELAARVKSLRVHGESPTDKYDALRIGVTGRLDTIQAAVLIEKLKIFPEEIVARQAVAARYAGGLAEVAMTPRAGNELTSVWAQYTIRARARAARCARRGAEGARAFRPRSITPSRCIARRPIAIFRWLRAGLPVCEQLAEEVISLPMHAYLEPPVQDRIIEAVRRALTG